MPRAERHGFTLLELLVTITILAVLTGVALNAFSKVSRSGQRAKDQELVSEVATSLIYLIQEKKVWPTAILKGVAEGEGVINAEVAAAFAKEGLMNIISDSDADGVLRTIGRDRLGLVDSYGAAVLKRNKRAGEDAIVPSGGLIRDHLIRYAIDDDDDGITEATVGGRKVRVRAAAIAWGCGPDGKVEDPNLAGRTDDVFSWRLTQEVR